MSSIYLLLSSMAPSSFFINLINYKVKKNCQLPVISKIDHQFIIENTLAVILPDEDEKFNT